MIIQCDHCSAKFRMDDSKLANGPVKVRCAKCKEVFTVSKEESPSEISSTLRQGGKSPQSDAAAGAWSTAETTPTTAAVRGFNGDVNQKTPGNDFSLNFNEIPSRESAETSFATENSEQARGLDLSFDGSGGDFDFGDSSSSATSVSAATGSPSLSASTANDDFSMDFGEVSFSTGDKPVTAEPKSTGNPELSDQPSIVDKIPAQAPAGEDVDFNFSFNEDSAAERSTSEPAMPKEGAVNFGEFEFGEMNQKPEGHIVPLNEKQRQDFSFDTESSTVSENMATPPADNDDIPPSSLSSRKKRGSLFPLTVILGAILLVILLAGSAVYFVSGPNAFSKVGLGFLVDWYGAKGGEEGSVSVRNITAEYLTNKEAGELFVVRGEALNNYKNPRASIQVKVTILGGGAPLLTKTAFCGNSLSKEQLATLPLAKLEETMNNQFGDSLANMGVKAGKSIPFVVVISGVPKEASDYSVQISGSTIATQ